MASVVVREVEMMQAAMGFRRASFKAEQDSSASEWRPPPVPAVALVDAGDAAWRTLVAEDGILEVRCCPAASRLHGSCRL